MPTHTSEHLTATSDYVGELYMSMAIGLVLAAGLSLRIHVYTHSGLILPNPYFYSGRDRSLGATLSLCAVVVDTGLSIYGHRLTPEPAFCTCLLTFAQLQAVRNGNLRAGFDPNDATSSTRSH